MIDSKIKTFDTTLRNGERIKVEVHPELQIAIDTGWDSFRYSLNNQWFIKIQRGDFRLLLTTDGPVEIYDTEKDKTLTNCDEEQLRFLVDSKELYEDDRYIFEEGNWFDVAHQRLEYVSLPDGEVQEVWETLGHDWLENHPRTIYEVIGGLLSHARVYLV